MAAAWWGSEEKSDMGNERSEEGGGEEGRVVVASGWGRVMRCVVRCVKEVGWRWYEHVHLARRII